MKTIITTGLFCAAIGAVGGWLNAADHYDAVMARANEEMRTAQDERNAQLAILSKGYYEQFEAITNREPATIERRVYVKADCVPAGASTGVDIAAHASGLESDRAAAGSAGKVELAQDTVQAVAGVAERAERLYQQCVTRLQYFQDRHEY